jgi:AcrR family transcriptional regulator
VSPPRPRAQLTSESIIDAAAEITAAGGAATLTVRRLGQRLGADPTAIYRHFRDKDEILLEVADRLLRRIADRLPEDVGWRARLEWIAREVVAAFVAHPAIGVSMASRTTRREGEFRLVDAVLGAMREAGLTDSDAVSHHRTFGDIVLAYAGMQASYYMLDEATRRRDEGAWSRDYLAVAPSRYPHIAALAPVIASFREETVLDLLIAMLLDGIETRAAAGRTQP